VFYGFTVRSVGAPFFFCPQKSQHQKIAAFGSSYRALIRDAM
jgi:hypothetical protein